jgi:N-acetylglutamate synthase/N-acetylornithine aminotransferase
MAVAVSPLAPKSVPAMPPIAGVKLATAAAGIKYANRTDVLLALLAPGTTVAGVFTKSKCPSAPVEWCRAILKHSKARALVVNSGNANAFTGRTGRAACKFTAELAAKAAGCKLEQVFLASTGVIGEPLPANQFAGVMDGLVAGAEIVTSANSKITSSFCIDPCTLPSPFTHWVTRPLGAIDVFVGQTHWVSRVKDDTNGCHIADVAVRGARRN